MHVETKMCCRSAVVPGLAILAAHVYTVVYSATCAATSQFNTSIGHAIHCEAIASVNILYQQAVQ